MALGPDDDVWAPPKHIIETVEAELTEAIRLIGDKGK